MDSCRPSRSFPFVLAESSAEDPDRHQTLSWRCLRPAADRESGPCPPGHARDPAPVRLDSGRHGVWRSLVAHPLWERGAVGSNPATPTLPTTSLDSWATRRARPAVRLPPGRLPRSTAAVKSTIEELGPTRVRMAIEVPWGDLDHAFGEVYKELGKQV